MNKAMDLKCPGCGNVIKHDPINNNFKCECCSSVYTIDDLLKTNVEYTTNELSKYTCKNCGAEIVVGDKEMSTSCIYCGNTAILTGRLSNEYRPDFIIPFKTTKEDVMKELKSTAKKGIEIDEEYLKNMNIESITPIYIPYFLYTYDLSADASFVQIGENKQNIIINLMIILISIMGRTCGGFVNYGRVNFSKKARLSLDKVPIDGSKGLEDDVMMNLFPYNFDEMVKYEHPYLSGHLSEMYDEPIEVAKEKMLEYSKRALLKHFCGSHLKEYSVSFINSYVTNEHVDYVLLPVWIINVNHNGENTKFYMNGQVKSIVGKSDYVSESATMARFMNVLSVCAILLFGFFDYKNMVSRNVFGTLIAWKMVFYAGLIFIVTKLFKFYINSKESVKKCDSLEIFKDQIKIREGYYRM